MNFETRANELKKRSEVVMGITIDWQYAMELFPKVFNATDKSTSEFKMICSNLNNFCSNIEKNIKELKAMIPHFED